MQCSHQDGFTACLPHHRRVDEPVIALFQGRSLSQAVATVPPIAEFAAHNEAPLTSGNIRLPLLGFSCSLHCAVLHISSIPKVASEATVDTFVSGLPSDSFADRCGKLLRVIGDLCHDVQERQSSLGQDSVDEGVAFLPVFSVVRRVVQLYGEDG